MSRRLSLTINIDLDMEAIDVANCQRVLKDDVELFVNGQQWCASAIRVASDPAHVVFALGAHNADVEALCQLAKTDAPRTLQNAAGNHWLLMLTPFEEEED